MRVLITGGAGFIGSHIVDLCLAEGLEVVVVDNLSTGRRENLNPEARFYEVDIRDASKLTDVFEDEHPDFVCHHAAQMDVRKSWVDPAFDAEVNVVGSLNVIRAASRFSVQKFIHIATSAVYGNPLYLPVDETHPICPICPYGASKHIIELYLAMFKKERGLDYVVFRYPNVYGPRQNPNGEAGVIAIFAGAMLKRAPVTIRGDGKTLRDYVYVSDIARANLLALTRPDLTGVYNLGSGHGTSVRELFYMLSALTNYGQEAQSAPLKPGEMESVYLDASRFMLATDWKPEVSLSQGLRKVVESLRVK